MNIPHLISINKYNLLFSLIFSLTACASPTNKKSTQVNTVQAVVNTTQSIRTESDDRTFTSVGKAWKSERQSKKINQLNFSATIVPTEYYIKKSGEISNSEEIEAELIALEGEKIIEFEIAHDVEREPLNFALLNPELTKPIEYLASTIQDDFSVVTLSGDTINCSGALFERNFKLASFKRVLLFFNGIPEQESIDLFYNDQLFQHGEIQFSFNTLPTQISNSAI